MTDPPEQAAIDDTPKSKEPTSTELVEDDVGGGDSKLNGELDNNNKALTSSESADAAANDNGGGDGNKDRAAPQAAEPKLQQSDHHSDEKDGGDFEDCKLSPLDFQNQRKNMKDVLMNKAASIPPPLSSEEEVIGVGGSSDNNSNSGGSAHNLSLNPRPSSPPHDHHQSALHQDEYSQYNNDQHQAYNPQNHESALEGGGGLGGGSAQQTSNNKQPKFLTKPRRKKHNRLAPASDGKKRGGHSNPRTTPYKSEIGRLRHAQQLEREKQKQQQQNQAKKNDDVSTASTSASHRSLTIKDTTAPPDSAFFSIQSSKFKHNILHSLGEFLTGAFADDEEASGSYFSNDLLDQLSVSASHLKGVWLQAKNLNDEDVKQLCEALVRNKIVTEVWLPSNCITDVGAGYIAHMLKFNKTIKELFLGENDIGPKGAASLASALARGNTTLVALGLGGNHIGVEGAGAFAAALRHNHSLHTLDTKKNGIPKKSSIRGLLNKMLEFNASDPGDESLVLGLQEELANLVSNLPPDMAESIVLQAEEALKTAMLCRKRGDKLGAAEAEGVFIRICTTGEAPMDPPCGGTTEEAEEDTGDKSNEDEEGKRRKEPPMDPEENVDGLTEDVVSSLKMDDNEAQDSENGDDTGVEGKKDDGDDQRVDEVGTDNKDEKPQEEDDEKKKDLKEERK